MELSVFSKNIRHLRKAMKLSQEEFAQRLGLKRGNIASYERATAEPKIENLIKIAKFFKVNLIDLLEEDLATESQTEIRVNEETPLQRLRFILRKEPERLNLFIEKTDKMNRLLTGFKDFFEYKKNPDLNIPLSSVELQADLERLLKITEHILAENENFLKNIR